MPRQEHLRRQPELRLCTTGYTYVLRPHPLRSRSDLQLRRDVRLRERQVPGGLFRILHPLPGSPTTPRRPVHAIGHLSSGTTLNTGTDVCQANPNCASGSTYNSTVNLCVGTATPTCATGYTYDSVDLRCEADPSCSGGGTFLASADKCILEETTTCTPTGFTYSSALSACIQSPNCPAGTTLNTTTDLCSVAPP